MIEQFINIFTGLQRAHGCSYIETTANHFLFLLGDNPSTALISMKSTSLSVSRKWLTTMLGIKLQGKNGLFTPPTYSHIYNLRTVQMTNDKGTWFGWTYNKVGPVKDTAIYEMAKNFSERISKGKVQAKPEAAESRPGISL